MLCCDLTMGQSSVLVTGLVSVSAASGLESSSSSTIYDVFFNKFMYTISMVDSHPKCFSLLCKIIILLLPKLTYSRHRKHWLATAYPCPFPLFSCSSHTFTRASSNNIGDPFPRLLILLRCWAYWGLPGENGGHNVWFKSSSLRDTKCCCDGSIDLKWILSEVLATQNRALRCCPLRTSPPDLLHPFFSELRISRKLM